MADTTDAVLPSYPDWEPNYEVTVVAGRGI